MAGRAARSSLRDWDGVDSGLRRMGEIDIGLSKLEGAMTLRVNVVREEFEVRAAGLRAERRLIERDIELFAEERKEEFARLRCKELVFGRVAYRVVQRMVVKSKRATVAALEVLGLEGCVRTTRVPDKELMKGLDPATLARVGAVVKTEDRLSVEPNMERVRGEREAA